MLLRKSTRRARLSMTSLIDVIFLLLLFFMLSSTFSKFAEVELSSGSAGVANSASQTYFLRLSEGSMSLNGQEVTVETLGANLSGHQGDAAVLVSVTATATAQMLMDVLVALRSEPGVTVTVLGGG